MDYGVPRHNQAMNQESAAINRKLKHLQIDANRRRREEVITESFSLFSGQRAESFHRDRLIWTSSNHSLELEECQRSRYWLHDSTL